MFRRTSIGERVPLRDETGQLTEPAAAPAKGMFLLTFVVIAVVFFVNLGVLLSYGARIGTLEAQLLACNCSRIRVLNAQVTTLDDQIEAVETRVTTLEGCACNETVECRQDTAVALLLDFVNSACDSIDFGNYTGPCPIVLADIIPPAACPGATCTTTLYEDVIATGGACSCDAQCATVNDTCEEDLCTPPPVLCDPGFAVSDIFNPVCEACGNFTTNNTQYSLGGYNAVCTACAAGCTYHGCNYTTGVCYFCDQGYGGADCDACAEFSCQVDILAPGTACADCPVGCDVSPGVCDQQLCTCTNCTATYHINGTLCSPD